MSDIKRRTRSQARQSAKQQEQQHINSSNNTAASSKAGHGAAAQGTDELCKGLHTDGTIPSYTPAAAAATATAAAGGPPQEDTTVSWQKVLWKKQPYPDNYTDSSFLQHLVSIKAAASWTPHWQLIVTLVLHVLQ